LVFLNTHHKHASYTLYTLNQHQVFQAYYGKTLLSAFSHYKYYNSFIKGRYDCRIFPVPPYESDTLKSSGLNTQQQVSSLGTTSSGAEEQALPSENRYYIGSQWFCNNGYEKVGDACQKIYVPQNAHAIGSQWFCNNGFKRVGNSCEKINIPANAHAIGSQWFCDSGYEKIGESCQKMYIPENASAIGSQWLCNYGYKKVGNACQKDNSVLEINIPIKTKSAPRNITPYAASSSFGMLFIDRIN